MTARRLPGDPPRVELHLHSDVSDGLLPPAELVRRALSANITTLALTDHDATDGHAPLAAAAAGTALRVLPAIELTARVRPGKKGTVHLVGLGIDPTNARLQAAARANRQAKRAQIAELLRALEARDGVALTIEGIAPGRPGDAYVGRNHVASALVRLGKARSHRHAFERYLEDGRAPTLEPVEAAEAVAAIKAAGGLVVLAHPSHQDLDQHLGPLCELGLDGLEVFRPRAVGGLLARVERAVVERKLLASGGSDWHGHYPEAPFGTWRLPAERVAPLLERLGSSA